MTTTFGAIVHLELTSRDFERSAAFYAQVFGWRPDEGQAGGHLGFAVPDAAVSGSWVRAALAQAPGPVAFVGVDDREKALAAVRAAGGRVLVPRLALGHRGEGALFADPDGNVVGILVTAGAASPTPPAKAARVTDAPRARTKSKAKAPAAKSAARKKT